MRTTRPPPGDALPRHLRDARGAATGIAAAAGALLLWQGVLGWRGKRSSGAPPRRSVIATPLHAPPPSALPPPGWPTPAPPPSPRDWMRSKWLWIGVTLLVLGVALRVAVGMVADRFLRQAFAGQSGFSGTYGSFSLGLLRLEATLHDVSFDRVPAKDSQRPLATIRRIEIDLAGSELVRGKLAGVIRLVEPRFRMVATLSPPDRTGEMQNPPPPPPDMARALEEAPPFRLDRLEIRRGEMTLVDESVPSHPELHVSGIEATLENLTTGALAASGKANVFAARAWLEESGEITLFFTADAEASTTTFAGQAKLKGLQLRELNPILGPKLEVEIEDGVLDVMTAFAVADGKMEGGVKPFLKALKTRADTRELWPRLKAALADVTFSLLSDRVPGRESAAAIVPIHGQLSDPRVAVLPAVLTVVRNAFVEGLAISLEDLPPPPGLVRGFFSTLTGSTADREKTNIPGGKGKP